MIKDRGMQKWTSMMLPEHLNILNEYKQERYGEHPQELTEWELEDLQQAIDQAYNQQLNITLHVWMDGKTTAWTGIVKTINFNTKELILETLIKTKHIPLQDIRSAQLEADYYD